jgi:hypothetical protein
MSTEFHIRKQGNGLFGLGEEVAPNVLLFRVGRYDLTKEELAQAVLATTVKPDNAKRGRQ